ncbi:hypothetical protein POTOM_056458 [Populus tomentosa]|uniref:Uncharacterized protein n=1 Tax=Populus tomentosa TaxID=118781 RepID=A0A8X7Y8K6_POPTO|nr:hypothetical protein POTOM_056458 [Populus tomentosa]
MLVVFNFLVWFEEDSGIDASNNVQTEKHSTLCSPTMHLPSLGSYVHGNCLEAITVRLEHDNKIMVTIRSIIVKYRAFP